MTHAAHREPPDDPTTRVRPWSLCLAMMAVLSAALLLSAWWTAPSGKPPNLLTTIDPNTAPWWELAALPGLGESKARAVVAFREEAAAASGTPRPFGKPSDLDAVPGIGVTIVQQLAPHLRFASP